MPDSHLHALQTRHREADQALREAQKHPFADEQKIRELKRRKLRLKDAMHGISRH